MGANLTGNGATFRVWAPNATAVHVIGDFTTATADDSNLLNSIGNGHWAGYIDDVQDREQYMFYVYGTGSQGLKRDPYARELASPFPGKCIIRDPYFPWHNTGYKTPRFEDFVIYQLHTGVFYIPRFPTKGTFLDVASKIPYLKDLGITIIQLMPVQEYGTQFSQGYNNLDFFSPETEFAVDANALPAYLDAVNQLLSDKHLSLYTIEDITGEMNQLKAFIDLCHIYGIGVVIDQVYNHAGGGWDDACFKFFDRQPETTDANSLYFIPGDFVGGLIFDFSKPEVRNFLIDNAKFFLYEYRVDGFRYDEVSTIDHRGSPNGWAFCQDLTSTLKFIDPTKFHHAEYWNVQNLTVENPPGGIGFSTTIGDSLRYAIRDLISNASIPGDGPLNMDSLASGLWQTNFASPFQLVQGPENQDRVHVQQEMRMAKLSDPSNARSWYATSRSRVSTGLLFTAPCIPMLFMGQEFLEDKQWSEDFSYWPNQFIYWDGLNQQKQMSDFLRYNRDLIALRWQYPALRGSGFSVTHIDNANRVLVFQRWIPGVGGDVMVVVHLGNSDFYGYRIGFPSRGTWKEVFNSDVYENWVNPNICGNGGSIETVDQFYDNLNYSAALNLPANGILVFAK